VEREPSCTEASCIEATQLNQFHKFAVSVRPWSRVVDLIGGLLLIVGLAATATYFDSRVSTYDEGGLLTNAFLLDSGRLHYRDFYSSYPPGISVLILLSWKLLGVSVTAARVLGFFLHVVLVAGAGRLAGRAAERPFSWFGAGVVALWLSPLGVVPMAWLAALGAAFWALHAVAVWLERESRISALGAGALLASVSFFRHDLFVYLCLWLLAGTVWGMVRSRRVHLGPSTPWLVAGLAIGLLAAWLPVFISAGVGRVAQDLYFDQVRHVMPGRRLPIGSPGPVPTTLWVTTIVVGLVGPLLGGGLVVGSRARSATLFPSLFLLILSLAVLPQMLGRSEWAHFLQTVAPAFCIVAVIVERVANTGSQRKGALAVVTAGMVVFLGWALVPAPTKWLSPPHLAFGRRESGMPAWQYDSLRGAVEFIQSHSSPGEPVFVGNSQHRLVTFNNLSLYYLAQRPGSTRHMQFDPGLTTSEAVQRGMIGELEARHTNVIVLLKGGYVPEPNRSSTPGSSLLDDYIGSRYYVVDSAGGYRMLLRR